MGGVWNKIKWGEEGEMKIGERIQGKRANTGEIMAPLKEYKVLI